MARCDRNMWFRTAKPAAWCIWIRNIQPMNVLQDVQRAKKTGWCHMRRITYPERGGQIALGRKMQIKHLQLFALSELPHLQTSLTPKWYGENMPQYHY